MRVSGAATPTWPKLVSAFNASDAASRPEKERHAGARLPYQRHIDEATLETRDGRLIQTIKLDGFLFETASTEEINYRKNVRDTMLRGMASSRFAIYHHVVRREVRPDMPGDFADGFSQQLNEAWRGALSSRKLYVNELFVSLVRRPLQGHAGWLSGLFGSARRAVNDGARRRQELAALKAGADQLIAALAPYGARRLTTYEGPTGTCSEPLEFLSLLYNGELRPVLLPTGDLGHYLPYRRISFGARALELSPSTPGSAGLATIISLKDYPSHSSPGMLDDVLRLPCEMVLTESFGFVDRQAALERAGLAYRRLRAADDEALSQRQELFEAKDDVAAGRAAFGEHHMTMMVRAETFEALDANASDLQSALSELGVIATREDVNLEPAFWAQFPGNFKDIGRRALISSANYASLASCHNFPIGQTEDLHWGAPVTVLETTSAGPYNFSFHHGDLGNFTLIGPSGSGKTVVLNFLLAQAQRFSPRTVFFDKDRGAEIFIRAIGGRYDALRPGLATGLNPLCLPDTPANRRFLHDWTGKLLSPTGVSPLTPEDHQLIVAAVDANFGQAAPYRRLRHFAELFQGYRRPSAGDLAMRLSAWHSDGEYAWLFDNPATIDGHDGLDLETRTIGFDLTQILDDPASRTPVMMYLFHRVEERLDGRPTIIVVDEGWKALDDEVFVSRMKDWEKTIRKRNGLVGFATQSAQDALGSRIASAIIEQAATQIFMVNPKAQESDYIQGFGLTDHEFEIIRTLPDRARCFLVKHGAESVVVRLDLSGMPDLLTVLSGRETTVRRLDRLRERLGDPPGQWLEALLQGAEA